MPSLFWIRLISYLPFKTTAKTFGWQKQAARIVYALKSYIHQDISSEPIVAAISAGIDTVLTLYQNQIKRGIEVIKLTKRFHLFSVTQKNWFGQI